MDAQWQPLCGLTWLRVTHNVYFQKCSSEEAVSRKFGVDAKQAAAFPRAHTYTAQRMTQQVSYMTWDLFTILKKALTDRKLWNSWGSPDAVRYFHLTSTAPELHLSVITDLKLLSLTFFLNRNIRILILTSFLSFCYFMCLWTLRGKYIDIAYSGVQLCFI